MRNRSAFTLIELLVVIAIISLLVSILVPSLHKAKDLARQAVCASNLHSLGFAFHLYALDNRDYMPCELIAYNVLGNPVYWSNEWYMVYWPYLRTQLLNPSLPQLAWQNRDIVTLSRQMPVFDCPATKRAVGFWGPGVGGYFPKTFDYVASVQAPTKLMKVPSDQYVLIDHTESHPSDGLVGKIDCASAPLMDGGLAWNTFVWPYRDYYIPGFHHNRGANMMFADGHVRWHDVYVYLPNFQLVDNTWWFGVKVQVPP